LPVKTYAASRYHDDLLKSSSGGVFAALAEKFLNQGNAVCGAVITEHFKVKHIIINDLADLRDMLGSKYVQSDIMEIFPLIDDVLKEKKCLFCGTPCQVDAIKHYTKNNTNLYTVEIICHGTPNNDLFYSYIKYLGHVKKFIFRDKRQGWSYNHLVKFTNGKEKRINHRLSSYMTCYYDLCRECCYECPYAKKERVAADITIGDYWGMVKETPELKDEFDVSLGVSAVLVNSEKGNSLIEELSLEELKKIPVSYESIRKGNDPLNSPTTKRDCHEKLLRLWVDGRKDWNVIEKYWKKNLYKLRYSIWAVIPENIRYRVRIMMGKR
jgi:coenzyme F420-reducing hydrogenase beta subunit